MAGLEELGVNGLLLSVVLCPIYTHLLRFHLVIIVSNKSPEIKDRNKVIQKAAITHLRANKLIKITSSPRDNDRLPESQQGCPGRGSLVSYIP